MRRITWTWMVLPLFVFGAACETQGAAGREDSHPGASTPPKAVVKWLDALDEGRFDRMAALAPPGLDETKRKELADDLRSRLGGLHRLEDEPFALTESDGEVRAARVVVGDGARRETLILEVVRSGGRWYVRPPRNRETKAM